MPRFRLNQKRTVAKATNWDQPKSPYETLELEGDADDEQIKISYRRLAKFYHPDEVCSFKAVLTCKCISNCVCLERTISTVMNVNSRYVVISFYFALQVYNGRGTLEEGETAEARFIKIQAAYELLIDTDRRKLYDMDNRVNPMKVILLFLWLPVVD
ncbi:chaperone dnaJ-domain containing protein [Trifolium pratense]|uniref:Chaperone dnaJ-domain containing protein n=1 Tax=Trifolium pratense TaxID=57577 RepID=A0A2K3PBI1_TRIPR|nr:chaperone dnaJ-domain containing protein [Trifolium pratense]